MLCKAKCYSLPYFLPFTITGRLSGTGTGDSSQTKVKKVDKSLSARWHRFMQKNNIPDVVYSYTDNMIKCNVCSTEFNRPDTDRTYKYARDHQMRSNTHSIKQLAWTEEKLKCNASAGSSDESRATVDLDDRYKQLIEKHGSIFERIQSDKVLCACGKALLLVSNTGDFLHNVSQHLSSKACEDSRKTSKRQVSLLGFFKRGPQTTSS